MASELVRSLRIWTGLVIYILKLYILSEEERVCSLLIVVTHQGHGFLRAES